eukprot:m.38039 g.38039  ORF g.38039 m.38039 type:complete len:588 (-) comp9383_c0_seq2:111-1874(-)
MNMPGEQYNLDYSGEFQFWLSVVLFYVDFEIEPFSTQAHESPKEWNTMLNITTSGSSQTNSGKYHDTGLHSATRDIARWDVNQVLRWLGYIGFGAYRPQFKKNAIVGADLLYVLDDRTLSSMEIYDTYTRDSLLQKINDLRRGIVPKMEMDVMNDFPEDDLSSAEVFNFQKKSKRREGTLAKKGHNTNSYGEILAVETRGRCWYCGELVLSMQRRGCRNGTYFHTMCKEMQREPEALRHNTRKERAPVQVNVQYVTHQNGGVTTKINGKDLSRVASPFKNNIKSNRQAALPSTVKQPRSRHVSVANSRSHGKKSTAVNNKLIPTWRRPGMDSPESSSSRQHDGHDLVEQQANYFGKGPQPRMSSRKQTHKTLEKATMNAAIDYSKKQGHFVTVSDNVQESQSNASRGSKSPRSILRNSNNVKSESTTNHVSITPPQSNGTTEKNGDLMQKWDSLEDRVVVIKKAAKEPLGVTFRGGFEEGGPAVKVMSVMPNSVSYTKLQPGDLIFVIDDLEVSKYTHDELVDYLKSCKGDITFCIKRERLGSPKPTAAWTPVHDVNEKELVEVPPAGALDFSDPNVSQMFGASGSS